MKRKFGFLAPLRIPSRAENRALRTHLETHGQDIQDNPSPLTPPLSGFIDRRELDHRTEAQLRAACTAIVKGELIPDTPTVLTVYRPIHSTKSVPHLPVRTVDGASRPQTAGHPAPAVPPVPALTKTNHPIAVVKSVSDLARAHDRLRESTKLDTIISRSRDDGARSAVEESKRSTFSPTTRHRSRTAPDESDGSCETPRTASTGYYGDNVSTAFTSTAITPSRPLQRVSGQMPVDDAPRKAQLAKIPDRAQTVAPHRREWDTRESSVAEAPPRPASRSRFREWIGRPSSRSALRPNTAISPLEPPATRVATHEEGLNRNSTRSSNHGHVPFALHNHGSQRHVPPSGLTDRPSVEGTHFDIRSASALDLDRPLPRLPALDTWNQNVEAATVHSEPTPTVTTIPQKHVVDMMKASALKSTLLSSTLNDELYVKEVAIVPNMEHSKEIAANMGSRISRTHSRSTSNADSCFSPSSVSRSQAASHGERKQSSLHRRGVSDAPTSYSIGSQPSLSRSGAISSLSEASVPNFSRKISLDSTGGIRPQGVTALPQLPPTTPKSKAPKGLRKVLSSFQLINVTVGNKRKTFTGVKKENGSHWMDRFEREGIKTGVMVSRGHGAAAAPIVRY